MAQSEETKKNIMALWNAGNSASTIAARMGLTRNAIIGIVARNRTMDTRYRAAYKPKRPPKAYVQRESEARKQPSIATLPPPRLPVIPSHHRYEAKGTCQYFIDDKKCGAESNGSWCDDHRKIVYVDRSTIIKSNNQMHKIARIFRVQDR